MPALEHITNFPSIEPVGDRMVRIVVESDDHICNLCMELEKFEAWLDFAQHEARKIGAARGAEIVPIRRLCEEH